jgi:hypothetical protein
MANAEADSHRANHKYDSTHNLDDDPFGLVAHHLFL